MMEGLFSSIGKGFQQNFQFRNSIRETKPSQVNFFSNIRIYIHKKIKSSITEIKTTTTAVIKNELKYFLMSEGHTCIAEPKREVLPFI